jgi:hypothetical protein
MTLAGTAPARGWDRRYKSSKRPLDLNLRAICEELRAAGIEVWFDQSELRGGDAWDQPIPGLLKLGRDEIGRFRG